jgi:hypothetical protein
MKKKVLASDTAKEALSLVSESPLCGKSIPAFTRVFLLLSLMAIASLPTKYLVSGISDLIALKMTS